MIPRSVGGLVIGYSFLLIAAAEGQVADRGTLIIRRAGQEIGREDFTIKPGDPDRRTADSLISVARYPEGHPTATFRSVLERFSTGAITLRLDQQSAEGSRQVYATGNRRRVTVRSVALGSETARDFPGGDPLVLLDDGVFTPFLVAGQLATESPTQVWGVYPRSGRRVTFTATRSTAAVNVGGILVTAVRLSGELEGALYLDDRGRLTRLELQTADLDVTRLRN